MNGTKIKAPKKEKQLSTTRNHRYQKKINTNIEDTFTDERIPECFIAEAIIQNLMAGKYVDPTDVKNSFQHEQFCDIVLNHCQRYGIK